METKQYTRKPFPVSAVQVTLQNIEEVARWCKGTIEYRPTKMMGTTTDLPVIVLKDIRSKDFEAALGCWVVELKGSFRSYKPAQFDASFDEIHPPTVEVLIDRKIVTDEEGTPERLQEAEEFADSENGTPDPESSALSLEGHSDIPVYEAS